MKHVTQSVSTALSHFVFICVPIQQFLGIKVLLSPHFTLSRYIFYCSALRINPNTLFFSPALFYIFKGISVSAHLLHTLLQPAGGSGGKECSSLWNVRLNFSEVFLRMNFIEFLFALVNINILRVINKVLSILHDLLTLSRMLRTRAHTSSLAWSFSSSALSGFPLAESTSFKVLSCHSNRSSCFSR